MIILFSRHGETVAGSKNKFEGLSNSELTARGIEQAEKLASFCKSNGISRIYSSPLKRCLETAKIAGNKINQTPIIKEELKEVCYGSWESLERSRLKSLPAWKKRKENLFNFKHPGSYLGHPGQSYADIYKKCLPFFEEILKASQNTLIVSHHGVLKSAWLYFNKISFSEFGRIDFPNNKKIILSLSSAKVKAIEL